MKFEIKYRWSNEVKIVLEGETRDKAIIQALKDGKDLSGSNLRGSNLRGSDLSDSNLSGSDLSDSNLSDSNLRVIKHDIWGVLLMARNEVPKLREMVILGKINGSVYQGECSCLCGTIANIKNACISDGSELPFADSNSPAEKFFMGIKEGDTPETNPVSACVLAFIDEFIALTK